MTFLKKIIYSIVVLTKVFFKLQNPWELFAYFRQGEVTLDFKNNLKFKTLQLLDPIIIKETIFDDSYKLSQLSAAKLIIDVGAGIGDFAIFAAKKFRRAEIIAFEADRRIYRIFLENIRFNKAKNIYPHNFAIGTKAKYDFYLSKFHAHSSTVSAKKMIGKIEVLGRKLDQFIKEKVDFLKIDVEGAEIDVLESVSKKKMNLIKKIVVEYHNVIVENSDLKIISLLKGNGFATRKIEDKIVPGTGCIFATR